MLEADFVYACEGLPRQVALVWDGFEGTEWMGERFVPILVQQDRHIEMISLLPDEPEFIWHSKQARERRWQPEQQDVLPAAKPTIPGASIAVLVLGAAAATIALRRRVAGPLVAGLAVLSIVGAGLLRDLGRVTAPWLTRVSVPAPDQALTLFEALHHNVYAAFEAAGEDEIYETLARSVDAATLDELYGEVYESLILREEGGAVCSIDRIEVLEKDVDLEPVSAGEAPRFDVDWAWRVYGLVAHWGHIHRRTNQYRATYTVQHDGISWKIAGVQLHEHERIEEDG